MRTIAQRKLIAGLSIVAVFIVSAIVLISIGDRFERGAGYGFMGGAAAVSLILIRDVMRMER
jgi:hypothetical protein